MKTWNRALTALLLLLALMVTGTPAQAAETYPKGSWTTPLTNGTDATVEAEGSSSSSYLRGRYDHVVVRAPNTVPTYETKPIYGWVANYGWIPYQDTRDTYGWIPYTATRDTYGWIPQHGWIAQYEEKATYGWVDKYDWVPRYKDVPRYGWVKTGYWYMSSRSVWCNGSKIATGTPGIHTASQPSPCYKTSTAYMNMTYNRYTVTKYYAGNGARPRNVNNIQASLNANCDDYYPYWENGSNGAGWYYSCYRYHSERHEWKYKQTGTTRVLDGYDWGYVGTEWGVTGYTQALVGYEWGVTGYVWGKTGTEQYTDYYYGKTGTETFTNYYWGYTGSTWQIVDYERVQTGWEPAVYRQDFYIECTADGAAPTQLAAGTYAGTPTSMTLVVGNASSVSLQVNGGQLLTGTIPPTCPRNSVLRPT